VIDDIHLTEVYETVEDTECSFIQDSGEDDFFEEMKAVGLVDLGLDVLVLDLDYLAEFGGFLVEFTVGCLVRRDFGVIYSSVTVLSVARYDLHSRTPRMPIKTLSFSIRSSIPLSFSVTACQHHTFRSVFDTYGVDERYSRQHGYPPDFPDLPPAQRQISAVQANPVDQRHPILVQEIRTSPS
jgi:hypothetical protein